MLNFQWTEHERDAYTAGGLISAQRSPKLTLEEIMELESMIVDLEQEVGFSDAPEVEGYWPVVFTIRFVIALV